MTSIDLFKELSNCNDEGISDLISVDKFVDKYTKLQLGNGGGWCRFDSSFGKKYKVVTIKKNGNISYSWELDEDEKEKIYMEIQNMKKEGKILIEKKGTAIKYIKMYG